MKKFIKTLGLIVLLPLFYGGFAVIFSYAYGFFDLINTGTSQALLSTSLDYVIESITFNRNIFFVISGIIIICLLFLMKGNLLKECRFNTISFKNIVYVCILSICSSIFINTLTIVISSLFHNYYEFQEITQEAITLPIFQLGIIILILPILEEVFFRGVIFGYLRKNYKLITAILVQALVFGIFTMNIVQGIYSALLAILIALIYNHTDSLYLSMIFHIVFNFFGIIIFPYLYAYFSSILYVLTPLAIVVFSFVSIMFFRDCKK